MHAEKLAKHRDEAVDFAKGALIILMVAFHLPDFVAKLPSAANDIVYAFHMPGFLVLSGFFTTVAHTRERLTRLIRTIAIPYILLETLYLIGIGLAGELLRSNNSVELSFSNIVHHLCCAPVGTYWYLHTLLICSALYILFCSCRRLSQFHALILSSIACFLLSLIIGGLEWSNCMYFFIGAFFRLVTADIKQIIFPSLLSGVGFMIMCFATEEYSKYSLAGLFLTLSALSFFMAVQGVVHKGISSSVSMIGRNSLCIVLFSPIFTIPSKFYLRYFDFDPSGWLFGLFSVALVIALCLLTAKLSDRAGISRYIFGRRLYI